MADEFVPAALQDAAKAVADATAAPTPNGASALGSIWDSIRSLILMGAIGLGVLIFNLYRNQNSILYHPTVPQMPFKRVDDTPGPFASPADESWRLAFEEHYLTTLDGVKIHAWWIPAPATVDASSAPTVVHFHANALHMGFRLSLAKSLHEELGANVALASYRGYGNSDGTPSERGIELDADAILSWVTSRPDVDKRKIFLHGQSLGGAVAVQAAAVGNFAPHVAGVVLENTFTSIPAMVDHLMPWLRLLKPLVLRIGWRSIDIIHRMTCPVLFISGLKDELVPPTMMRQLHDAAVNAEEKEIMVVPDGGHNDTQMKAGASYWARLRGFIERTLRRKLGPDAVTRTSTTEYRKAYQDKLAGQMGEEAARQERLALEGKLSRFEGAVMGSGEPMPATAGPAVPLDLPPGGEATVALSHIHMDSKGVAGVAEGASELVAEAAEDEELIRAREQRDAEGLRRRAQGKASSSAGEL